MFVAPWSPTATLDLPVITTIPVWVTLKNIPNQLYSIPGISWVASGLGAPMATNKPRLDPILMGEAKILVEVELELDKQFPKKIAVEDKKGKISMVIVEYSWIPSTCERCGHLGHKDTRCLQQDTSGPKIEETSSRSQLASNKVTASIPARVPSFNDFTLVVPTAERVSSRVESDLTNVAVTNTVDSHSVSVPSIGDTLVIIPATQAKEQSSVSSDVAATSFAPSFVPCFVPAENASTINENALQVSETATTVEVASTVTEETTETTSITINAPITLIKLAAPLQTALVTATQGNLSPPTVVDGLDVPNESGTMVNEEQAVVINGNNLFAALEFAEEIISDEESSHDIDLLTASAQRILRDRPMKPSQKVEEMQTTHLGGGRGNGGRG